VIYFTLTPPTTSGNCIQQYNQQRTNTSGESEVSTAMILKIQVPSVVTRVTDP